MINCKTMVKGELGMAYETKVLLIAIARLVKAKAEGRSDIEPYKEIYKEILKMANAEGVVLDPFDDSD